MLRRVQLVETLLARQRRLQQSASFGEGGRGSVAPLLGRQAAMIYG